MRLLTKLTFHFFLEKTKENKISHLISNLIVKKHKEVEKSATHKQSPRG